MRPADLLDLLREFYAEKVGLKRRHEAGVQRVAGYDFNNTYQYVINREEAHLDWLRRAIAAKGGALPAEAGMPAVPQAGKGAETEAAVLEDDSRLLAQFLERWRPRVEAVTDSRDKIMLRVVLGEMLEQKRFFDQACAGRTDLLGRRTSPSQASGAVLPTRWVE